MKRIIKYIVLICIIWSPQLYAQTYLCPNTYKYVNVGFTLAQVKQLCGEPTSQSKKRRPTVEMKDAEQWGYLIKRPKQITAPQQTLTVAFENDKVASLTLNGQRWNSTAACGNPVSVGDTKPTVRGACGAPYFINSGQQQVVTGIQNVVVWEYDYGPYKPKAIFTFQNDKLTSITTTQP